MTLSLTGALKGAALLVAALFCLAEGGFAEASWVNSDITAAGEASDKPSPRDDFHRAVNYEWLSTAKFKSGESRVNSFSERDDEVEEQIKGLLTDGSLKGHEAELTQKFHRMLLDWNDRDRLGVEPVMPYIRRIEAIKSIEDLTAYLTDAKDPHFGSLLMGVGTTADSRDATNETVAIWPSGLLLADADEYRAAELSASAKRRKAANDAYIMKLLQKAGYGRERARAMNDGLFRIERKLAAKSMGLKALRMPAARRSCYNVRTKKELAAASKRFPLAAIVDSEGYGESREFVLREPEWLKNINEVYAPENLEDIKSLLVVKTLLSTANLLDREARGWAVERVNSVMGSSGEIPDDQYAYEMVSAYLDEPLGRVYAEKYADPTVKARVEELISKVTDYYREMLSKEEWLTKKTREKAIAKLDALTVRAAYPEKWEDFSELDFKDNAAGGNLVEAAAAIGKFERKRDAKLVNSKVDKSKWIAVPQTVNAYYSPADNSINIPAGILGGVFYPRGGGAEGLLGGIGMVIGHEITHAFDTNGSQYDENGNLSNWWTKKDKKEFDARAKAISDYFSTLDAAPGVKTDGELVLSEAIADLGGLSCMAAIARESAGFDFAKFFEAYAKVWRSRATKESEEYRIKEDVHPLPFLRTNANVQQLQEFYDAFGVEPGDGMYLAPEKRITLW
ncbi:M13-type metalloendopeptidase [Synergistes jonesii]|uniref:M13-type metalloendopeptidase n=1 Tax=Synergistes jonesii TaxID=2754 RepID=UPI0024304B08|nr:M13 family metallopeptidase [Synergistes jonesii]